ncbi:hypothetical protein [Pelodictyon luteolum]|uniref:Cache domain-containing protein n=1 Tax=Chlorobium luteolum (strain DSM 273 / BCRC 81028 / 2530) TaxID=319225 RepID=Q3B4K1_CHLL3|nr:hypothetical protein [Pelodictyon luteolum]ABB23730.1 hypothetical protein Plut_0865 [Pelodictyon luteolum DSM 273]
MPLDIKAVLRKYFYLLPVVFFLTGLATLYYIQTVLSEQDAVTEISLNLKDVEGWIDHNESALKLLQEESDEQSIAKAHAFAYMINLKPAILHTPAELDRIRSILNVDELHVANSRGILIASTIPDYVGYRYESDPQSSAFMLAIDYPEFAYAQPLMPKGADKSIFQYTGVARLDEKGIVQTGNQPKRLLKAMAATDIRELLTDVRLGKSGKLLVTDLDGVILSASDRSSIGKELHEFGFQRHEINGTEGKFHTAIAGRRSYCVYRVAGDHIIIGLLPTSEIYAERNIALLVFSITGLLTLILPVWALNRKYTSR